MKKVFRLRTLYLLIILSSMIFWFTTGCKNKKNVQYQSKAVIYAYMHTREGITQWSFGVRTIYISQTVNDKPLWDTAWEYPTKFRYDSLGIKKDTAGHPLVYSRDSLVWIGKDSVKWKGIEGIPVDSILRSFKPRNWKSPKIQNFLPPKTGEKPKGTGIYIDGEKKL